MIVKKWNGMNLPGVRVLVTDLIIPAASDEQKKKTKKNPKKGASPLENR